MCIAFTCLLSLVCHAQIQYDQLEGIWKFTKGEFKGGDYFDSASNTEYIAFEHDNTFKKYSARFVKKAGNITDTVYMLDSGVWKLDEKKSIISITENYYFNNGIWNSSVTEIYTDTIVSLGGRDLVLIDLESIKLTYERVYKVPEYLVSPKIKPGEKHFDATKVYSDATTLPEKNMLRLYLKNPNNQLLIGKYDYIRMQLKSKDSIGFRLCCPEEMSGYIDSVSGDSLHFKISWWKLVYFDTMNTKFYNTTEYDWFTSYKSSKSMVLHLRDINKVYHNTPMRESLHETSEVFKYITGFSALIAAPLVSINYRKGTFNSHRYFGWAGWSLVGFGTSLTVNLLTGEREYKVVLPNSNY